LTLFNEFVWRYIVRLRLASALVALLFVAAAHSQTFTTLFSFNQMNGGGLDPGTGLVFDRSDNLYGTTVYGGTFGCGTIFKVSSAATGRKVTVLRNLRGVTDGCYPESRFLVDSAGNLYGATSGGGAAGFGTVFELSPGTHGGWTLTVLYSFQTGCSNCGQGSTAALIFDLVGNLYGTTSQGGANSYGMIFELSPVGDGTWTEQTLYSFAGGPDGYEPVPGLIFDQTGNLFGSTNVGGAYMGGTAFELVPLVGGIWQKNTIYNFGQFDSAPGDLTVDASGNLYGAAITGGQYNYGTVFELVKESDGTWTHKILHSFQTSGSGDGNYPSAVSGPLLLDKGSNLWGVTTFGGQVTTSCIYGCGTIFRLVPNSDGTWSEVHFNPSAGGNSTGFYFNGGLVFDQHGNIYGTSSAAGATGDGSIYEFMQ